MLQKLKKKKHIYRLKNSKKNYYSTPYPKFQNIETLKKNPFKHPKFKKQYNKNQLLSKMALINFSNIFPFKDLKILKY